MRFLVRLLVLLTIVVLVGGVAFLATWDIPPPTHSVEKTIPNDRFDP
jgi:hypothetical protein